MYVCVYLRHCRVYGAEGENLLRGKSICRLNLFEPGHFNSLQTLTQRILKQDCVSSSGFRFSRRPPIALREVNTARNGPSSLVWPGPGSYDPPFAETASARGQCFSNLYLVINHTRRKRGTVDGQTLTPAYADGTDIAT